MFVSSQKKESQRNSALNADWQSRSSHASFRDAAGVARRQDISNLELGTRSLSRKLPPHVYGNTPQHFAQQPFDA